MHYTNSILIKNVYIVFADNLKNIGPWILRALILLKSIIGVRKTQAVLDIRTIYQSGAYIFNDVKKNEHVNYRYHFSTNSRGKLIMTIVTIKRWQLCLRWDPTFLRAFRPPHCRRQPCPSLRMADFFVFSYDLIPIRFAKHKISSLHAAPPITRWSSISQNC